MAVGLVGGATKRIRGARRAQAPRRRTARRLAEIIVAVGLAQNLARAARAGHRRHPARPHGACTPATSPSPPAPRGAEIDRVAGRWRRKTTSASTGRGAARATPRLKPHISLTRKHNDVHDNGSTHSRGLSSSPRLRHRHGRERAGHQARLQRRPVELRRGRARHGGPAWLPAGDRGHQQGRRRSRPEVRADAYGTTSAPRRSRSRT